MLAKVGIKCLLVFILDECCLTCVAFSARSLASPISPEENQREATRVPCLVVTVAEPARFCVGLLSFSHAPSQSVEETRALGVENKVRGAEGT